MSGSIFFLFEPPVLIIHSDSLGFFEFDIVESESPEISPEIVNNVLDRLIRLRTGWPSSPGNGRKEFLKHKCLAFIADSIYTDGFSYAR